MVTDFIKRVSLPIFVLEHCKTVSGFIQDNSKHSVTSKELVFVMIYYLKHYKNNKKISLNILFRWFNMEKIRHETSQWNKMFQFLFQIGLFH